MYKMKFCYALTVILAMFLSSNAFANKNNFTSQSLGTTPKNVQQVISKKIISEVKKHGGPNAMKALRNAKSQGAKLAALKRIAKVCRECKMTKQFVGPLTSTAQSRTNTNVSAAFWGNDRNGCGWAHCLSHWGQHIPCKGMPGDPQEPDPEPSDDETGSPEDERPCDPNHETCPTK